MAPPPGSVLLWSRLDHSSALSVRWVGLTALPWTQGPSWHPLGALGELSADPRVSRGFWTERSTVTGLSSLDLGPPRFPPVQDRVPLDQSPVLGRNRAGGVSVRGTETGRLETRRHFPRLYALLGPGRLSVKPEGKKVSGRARRGPGSRW